MGNDQTREWTRLAVKTTPDETGRDKTANKTAVVHPIDDTVITITMAVIIFDCFQAT